MTPNLYVKRVVAQPREQAAPGPKRADWRINDAFVPITQGSDG